jgi:glycosyltransferase involved in cell wall biosynthesis
MSVIRVQAFYTRYPHIGSYAGIRQVLRHLDDSSASVTVRAVSDSDGDWPLPEAFGAKRLRRAGMSRGMAWYKLSDLAAELRVLPACLANSLDIVHFLDAEHTGQFLQTWIRQSGISRVKTIGTFHQPPDRLGGLINRNAVRSLDLAIAVSPTQVPFLREFLPAERVATVLLGVDTTFFRPADSRPLNGRFRCLTAGHWLRDWPVLRAIAGLLAAHQDIECHIVTDRETGLEGLSNVCFHRNVDDGSLLRLYQHADVLVLPLIDATANNSLVEGLACGLPIIATRLPSIMAYTGDQSALLIADNDPQEFVQAVLELREDAARRRTMSLAARARAENVLALPRLARDLLDIYRTLASPAS